MVFGVLPAEIVELVLVLGFQHSLHSIDEVFTVDWLVTCFFLGNIDSLNCLICCGLCPQMESHGGGKGDPSKSPMSHSGKGDPSGKTPAPDRLPISRPPPEHGTKGRRIMLLTNHFKVSVKRNHDFFYHYSIRTLYIHTGLILASSPWINPCSWHEFPCIFFVMRRWIWRTGTINRLKQKAA